MDRARGKVSHTLIGRPESPAGQPPAYETLGPSEDEALRVETLWDEQRATSPESKLNNIQFEFASPRLTWSLRQHEPPRWRATLFVWAENIPRLMRHGFHWSPANVHSGAGSMDLRKLTPLLLLRRCRHMRRYVVNGHGWQGYLCIYAVKESTITDFDLEWIKKDTVQEVVAYNWKREKVYQARPQLGHCFNAVYGQMRLQGWWPWPK
ncbi:uncharacterized protein F5Z01DRAFT_490191 [Emericellopsis atlantica]|uniref:Uncharacterized protein n=1 Tax=Emericellopsis atlantica TaxID=2614577 RepID=A0A9P7ZR88_9HYPO|nr:uncharacterized protein F5Z01DRAFT_490191 [Emericellopsis atlantica]KAG9256838.1 hypothetical protein F5Z01DRAFT_490191 [Emericellopsis atlantica]